MPNIGIPATIVRSPNRRLSRIGFADKPAQQSWCISCMNSLEQAQRSAQRRSPARFVFLPTDDAKQRLIPCLAPGDVERSDRPRWSS